MLQCSSLVWSTRYCIFPFFEALAVWYGQLNTKVCCAVNSLRPFQRVLYLDVFTNSVLTYFGTDRWRPQSYSAGELKGKLLPEIKFNYRLLTENAGKTPTHLLHAWILICVASTKQILFYSNIEGDTASFPQLLRSSALTKSFHKTTSESILTGNVITRYRNCVLKTTETTLQNGSERSAGWISRSVLLSLQEIYTRILQDPTHPDNGLFWLRSGKRLCKHMARTERLRRASFPKPTNRTINCYVLIFVSQITIVSAAVIET